MVIFRYWSGLPEKMGRRQGEGQKKTERSRNKSDRFRIMEVDYYKMADPSVLSHCLKP